MKVDFDIDEEGRAIDIYPDFDADVQTKTVKVGEGFLWFLCCFPIGFMRFGQSVKGWCWLSLMIFLAIVLPLPSDFDNADNAETLASFVYWGVIITTWVDYWMCFSAQNRRRLNDWEFFPK